MLGFTRTESRVLLFLTMTFIIGFGIKIYRTHWSRLPDVIQEAPAMTQVMKADSGKGGGKNWNSETEGLPVNINEADRRELERLPGIGPVIASRIIEYRQIHGAYQSLDELKKIKGIGNKTIELLKPQLTFITKGRKSNGRES